MERSNPWTNNTWFWLRFERSKERSGTAQLSKIKVLAYHDTFRSRHIHTIVTALHCAHCLVSLILTPIHWKFVVWSDSPTFKNQSQPVDDDWCLMGALSSSLSWHFPISSRSHNNPWVSLCTLLDFLDFDSYFLKVYCLVDPKKEVAQLNFQKSKSIDWEFFSSSLSWHFLIASRSHDCHCIALCRLFPWIWLQFFESF